MGHHDELSGRIIGMDVKQIVTEYIKAHDLDGLCNDVCGCGLDDLAPCGDGPFPDCCTAKSRVLGPDEYKDDCGPGDVWFTCAVPAIPPEASQEYPT